MASYYYLISSLPMLRAGDAPPLDYAAFLDQCRGAVSDRVYRSLEELTVRSEDGGFVSRWAAFYRVLQGELTYQRRVKRGESCAALNTALHTCLADIYLHIQLACAQFQLGRREDAQRELGTARRLAAPDGCSRWNLTGWMSWWDCTASTIARSTATR